MEIVAEKCGAQDVCVRRSRELLLPIAEQAVDEKRDAREVRSPLLSDTHPVRSRPERGQELCKDVGKDRIASSGDEAHDEPSNELNTMSGFQG